MFKVDNVQEERSESGQSSNFQEERNESEQSSNFQEERNESEQSSNFQEKEKKNESFMTTDSIIQSEPEYPSIINANVSSTFASDISSFSENSQQTLNKQYQELSGHQILRSIKANLKTNPFKKWEIRKSKHLNIITINEFILFLYFSDKFPIKFLLHIVLIIFVTIQVQLLAKEQVDFTRFNIAFWKSTLLNLNNEAQFDIVDYENTSFYLSSYYFLWPVDKKHRVIYFKEIDLSKGIQSPFNQYERDSLKTKFAVNSLLCWDLKIQYIIDSQIKVEASVDAQQISCSSSISSNRFMAEDINNDEDNFMFKEALKNLDNYSEKENMEANEEIQRLYYLSREKNRRILADSLSVKKVKEELEAFTKRGRESSHNQKENVNYQSVRSPFKFQSAGQSKQKRVLVPVRNLKTSAKGKNSFDRKNLGFQMTFINFTVIALSITMFCLHLRYIYRTLVFYKSAKHATYNAYLNNLRKNNAPQQMLLNINSSNSSQEVGKLKHIYNSNQSIKWENLSFKEKLKFFNKWQFMSIIGNFTQICGGVLLFLSSQTLSNHSVDEYITLFSMKERLIGFGCFTAWITIVQYVEYDREHIIFSNILRKVAKQWFYTFFGILPVFMVFVIMGHCLYFKNEYFYTFGYTMNTLFSIYHGDSVSSFMNSINETHTPINLLYFIIYTCMFAMIVYNFFISTIGIAWDEIKERKSKKYLKIQLKNNYEVENQVNLRDSSIQSFTSSDQKTSSNKMNQMKQNGIISSQYLNNMNLIQKQINSEEEQQQQMGNSSNYLDHLVDYIKEHKHHHSLIDLKIEECKKYLWKDILSKKSQVITI